MLSDLACVRTSTHTRSQHVLRKLRKQAQAANAKVVAEDAALVESELDRLGGKTQLIKTIGERLLRCNGEEVNRCIEGYLGSRAPPSVFELSSNPNGVIQPTVAQDSHRFDDVALLAANAPPPPYGGAEFNFDFLAETMIPPPMDATMSQPPQAAPGPQQVVDFSQIQNFDWIANFLNATGGAAIPQGPQPQAGAEPVPSQAEADATWQAMVHQLGLNL